MTSGLVHDLVQRGPPESLQRQRPANHVVAQHFGAERHGQLRRHFASDGATTNHAHCATANFAALPARPATGLDAGVAERNVAKARQRQRDGQLGNAR